MKPMERPLNYVLGADGNPVPARNLREWGEAFKKGRTIARTELPKGVTVSTVFLGIDHAYEDGPAILFETMIFGGPHDDYQVRYATRAEAEAGHAKAVALASATTEPREP